MFANIATAVASSTAITLTLLYVMSLLIGIQPGAIVEPRDRHELGVWILDDRAEDPVDTIEPLPDKEFIEPPRPPQSTAPSDPNRSTGVTSLHTPSLPVINFNAPLGLAVNGPLVPMLCPSPTYPPAALRRGLEGTVVVEFDVGADGLVGNVRVVESSDAVFDEAAINAAQRFRFKPRVVDGIPLATPGKRYLFRFRMEAD